jgi:uncharacterized cupredoxin-like copper-binding protein
MRMRLLVVSTLLASAIGCTAHAAAPTKIQVSLLGEGSGDMQIKLSHSTVKAGKVEFDVANNSMTESHEMVLVRLKSPDQNIPVLKDKQRIDESKLKSFGEVSGLKAGAHGKLVAQLSPGTYELLCNLKGHYESGMHTVLTVTK